MDTAKKSQFNIQDGRYGLDLMTDEQLLKIAYKVIKEADKFTGTQFGPSARQQRDEVIAYIRERGLPV